MEIFTSSKRRVEHAAQTRLHQAQNVANRLHMFLPKTALGLDNEGYQYAMRAAGMLTAIAGWPSLVRFIYEVDYFEHEIARPC